MTNATGFFGFLAKAFKGAPAAAPAPESFSASTLAETEISYFTRYPHDMPSVNKEIERVRGIVRGNFLTPAEKKSVSIYLRGLENFSREWGNRCLTAKLRVRTAPTYSAAVFEVYTAANKLLNRFEYRIED